MLTGKGFQFLNDKSVWKCISRFTFWARVPLYSYPEVFQQTCSDRFVTLWRSCAMPSCKSTLMQKSAWKSEIWKIAMTNPVQTHRNLMGKINNTPMPNVHTWFSLINQILRKFFWKIMLQSNQITQKNKWLSKQNHHTVNIKSLVNIIHYIPKLWNLHWKQMYECSKYFM